MFFTPAPPENAAVKVAVPFPRLLIPGPEKVPDGAWLPVRVMAGVLLQIFSGSPEKPTVGNGLTVNVMEFDIAGFPLIQGDATDEVSKTVITSPFNNPLVVKVLPVAPLIGFAPLYHW
jgi:hypothetical protein